MYRYFRQFMLYALISAFFAGMAIAGEMDKSFAKAVANGDLAGISSLLEKGADVNAQNKEGETALMVASLEGRIEVARVLIEKGADINIKDSIGATALLYAAMGGSLDIMKLLIEKGADTGARTNDGETALSISRLKGNDAAVEFLMKNTQ